jgi:hypothetical protein
MTYRQEKRIFYNWLRRKNLLEIYKQRHAEDPNPSDPRALREGANFIFRGLSWFYTPEGFDFWFHLDMKWRKHLHRKRRKYRNY